MTKSSEMRAGKSRDEIATAYKVEPWWHDLRGFFILTFACNRALWEQLPVQQCISPHHLRHCRP